MLLSHTWEPKGSTIMRCALTRCKDISEMLTCFEYEVSPIASCLGSMVASWDKILRALIESMY
jgi:hypothetical protein